MPDIPHTLDYSTYLTLNRHQAGGGCGAYATMHAFDIQLERQSPYSPDMSYAFLSYVWNDSMGFHTTKNPNVTTGKIDQLEVLKHYGCVPEVSFPSNYDPPNAPFPNEVAPSNELFLLARNYRLKSYSTGNKPSSIEELKEWLYIHGPLIFVGSLENPPPGAEQHVITLIGYNDDTQQIKYVNSTPCEVSERSYSFFMDRVKINHASVSWLEVSPHVQPFYYTARIKISGCLAFGRRALQIKIGVEGKDPLLIWNQNCHVTNIDTKDSLTIDVPLPAYAHEYWPPTKGDWWYVDVTDFTDAAIGGERGYVDEIVLVQRLFRPDGRCMPLLYHHQTRDLPIIAGKTIRVYLPSRKKTLLTLKEQNLGPLAIKNIRFFGNLAIQYKFTDTDSNPIIPLANKKISIYEIKSDQIEGGVDFLACETTTGVDGSYSIDYSYHGKGNFRAIASDNDGKVIANSGIISVITPGGILRPH